jgi:L-cysteine:1D-myo-inositol 2-amino-2-deoxy-alpha-D-glucopyranoside ligase
MNHPAGDSTVVLHGPPDGDAPLRLGRRVTLYVCGITPYDAAHVGHAFTYVAFDTLVRFLRGRGHQVAYCQNVTDVDDDVLARAARNGEDYLALGRRETAAYLQDMDALNVARPSFFPKATEEIPAMVELAGRLVSGGHAYVVDGTVFFEVASYPGFGELSGLDPDRQRELLAERGGDPADPRKHHPLDFVVWQRCRPGEPWWDSPWGRGRPGWHLECSAMSRRYLGVTLDLHGGGADLLYPHHESERAQSESANGAPFVRRWLHAGMVRHQGEKMSKSLGNLVFPRDLFRDHEPAAVRLVLLAHHWRSSWEWDPAELKEAAERLSAWRQACGYPTAPRSAMGYAPPPGDPDRRAPGAPRLADGRDRDRRVPGEPRPPGGAGLPAEVDAALAGDLDTVAALAVGDELAERGDRSGLLATAAVLGVDLGPGGR